MKIKSTVLTTLSIFFAFGALYAQNQIPLQGDVSIEDDPTTIMVTEGNLSISGNLSLSGNFVMWTGSATGTNSVSLGGCASGDYSFALWNSYASGFNSIAMAGGNAAGAYSISIGSCSAASMYSTSIGLCTYGGQSSVAIGNECIADAGYSTVIGSCNYVFANYSTAIGFSIMSYVYAQTTIGIYNDDSIAGSSTEWILTDPLFVVGNGTAYDQRSNALVMLKNGDTTLNGHMTAKSYTVTEAAGGIPMGPFARQEQE